MTSEVTLETLHADLIDLRRLVVALLRSQSEETELVDRTDEAQRQIHNGESTSFSGDEYLELLDDQAQTAAREEIREGKREA